MKRLTTDNPESNMESAHNIFSIKNGTTVCCLTEDNHEITLYDLMRHCAEVLHCSVSYDGGTDNDIGEFLTDHLFDSQDSPEWILAHFFTTAWAFSELRAKLKAYEDTGFLPEELNRRAAPENKPLTLDQLRKMEGEPVWNEKIGYRLVGNFYKHVNLYALREQSVDAEGLMNLGERIYARRPEPTQ